MRMWKFSYFSVINNFKPGQCIYIYIYKYLSDNKCNDCLNEWMNKFYKVTYKFDVTSSFQENIM